MYLWGKHAKLLRIGSFIQRPLPPTAKTNMASPASMVFAGLGQKHVKTIQKCWNAENQPEISRVLPHLADRETFKRSRTPWCVKGVSSIYANNADIFYHRSMEKDKLSILDVCGAYGQKDIEKLDRSEIKTSLHVMATDPTEGLFFSNYTDILYHRTIRSMEKDKLFVLDVCGAYGQKDGVG